MRARALASAAAAAAACALGLLTAPAASADTTFRGTWLCNWKIDGDYLPMAGARVELLTPYVDLDEYDIPGNFRVVGVTHTDAAGNWSFTFGSDDDGDDYWVRVLTNGNGVRMHDLLMPWPFFVDSDRNQNDVPLHDYGRIVIHTYRCEVWTGLQRAYDDYVATTGSRPPYGDLDVTSHAITAGTPVTLFTDIWWPADYAAGLDPARADLPHGQPGRSYGLETAFHEFGHSFRHAFDAANVAHWLADVAFWNYAQRHSACKKTNSGFAFNEGWASYWAGQYSDGVAPDCGTGADDFSVEGNVTAALHRLQRVCGLTRAQMVDVLRSRAHQILPTSPIHTFDQFSAAAQAMFSQTGSCLRDRILGTVASARPEIDHPRSLGAIIGGLRRDASRTVSAAAAELSRARRGLRPAAERCRPARSCVAYLKAAIRVPIAGGKLDIARLTRKRLTTWSRKQQRILTGPPSRGMEQLVASRARSLRGGAAAIARRMFRRALAIARPLVRRNRSTAAKAILAFLRRSLTRASRGVLLPGLIPEPGRGPVTELGPAPAEPTVPAAGGTPPAPSEPPATPPPGAQPPPTGPPPPPAALPDLTITAITGLQTSNDAPTVHVTVRNAGAAGAPPAKLQLTTTRSVDEAHSDKLLDVPALAAGQSTTIDAPCEPYASDTATAVVDPGGQVAEADETNNALSAAGQPCRYP